MRAWMWIRLLCALACMTVTARADEPKQLGSVAVESLITSFAVSGDGRRLVAASWSKDRHSLTLHVFDIADLNRPVEQSDQAISEGYGPVDLSLSDDGKCLLMLTDPNGSS